MTDESLDSYLWDGSGEPDEDVRRIEHVLEPYRIAERLPPLASGEDSEHDAERQA